MIPSDALGSLASSTAFVTSSTNNGTPSVRLMMSCRMLCGIGCSLDKLSIMASTSRRVSRLIVRAVTWDCPIQGGSNSGRKVTTSSMRRLSMRFTVRLVNSRVLGSLQWASSRTISTGRRRVNVVN